MEGPGNGLSWLRVQQLRFLTARAQRKVIVFGGSYGGMLSSWMRSKRLGRSLTVELFRRHTERLYEPWSKLFLRGLCIWELYGILINRLLACKEL